MTMTTNPATEPAPATRRAKLSARDVDVFYGPKHAIRKVSIDIAEREVVAVRHLVRRDEPRAHRAVAAA